MSTDRELRCGMTSQLHLLPKLLNQMEKISLGKGSLLDRFTFISFGL